MKRACRLKGLTALLATAVLVAIVEPAPAEGPSVIEPGRSLEIASGTMEDPVYVRQLAEGRYLDGDLESAVRLYLEVAKLPVEPREKSGALLNASWLQFLLGREDQALTVLHAALRFEPDMEFDARLFSPEFEQVYLKARLMIVREGGYRPSEPQLPVERPPTGAEAIYREGVDKLGRGDDDAALVLLQRAASLTYGADEGQLDVRRAALLRLGLLYYDRGQWGDAATAFEEAVSLDRSDTSAWKNLGLAKLNQGELADAIGAFREAYARQPGDSNNARNLAQALVRAERWDDAASWIADAIRHHQRDPHLWLLMAEAQTGRGARERAAEARRAAMDLDDSLDWTHGRQAALLLTLSHLEAERFADAAVLAKAALEHDPGDATFWNLLGLAQQASGRAVEARDSFLRACDHDAGRAEYRNNLGRAYAAVGDLPQAEQEFIHALTLEPELPAAQANLAQVRKLLRR